MESAKDVGKNVEVNEYQEALDSRKEAYENLCGQFAMEKDNIFYEEFDVLQELVDRATPKKPIKEELVDFCEDDFTRYSCPICNYTLKTNHSCSNNECRQAIDWSKDER